MNCEIIRNIGLYIVMSMVAISVIFINGSFWYMYKEEKITIYIPFAIFVNLLTIGSILYLYYISWC